MASSQVEWRIDAANSLVVRLVVYGWIGLLGASGILVGSVLLGIAIQGAFAGDLTLLGWLLLLVLVGGPFSLLYLWPATKYGRWPRLSLFVFDPAPNPTETLADRYSDVFTWTGVAVAICVSTIVLITLFFLDSRLLLVYGIGWFVLLVLISGVIAWGRIDVDEPSFEYGTGQVPLSAIERVRRVRIGEYVCCWITYRSSGRTISTPSWITVTRDVEPVFDAAVEKATHVTSSTADSAETTSQSNAITFVAVGIGVGFLAFTIAIWFVEIATPVQLYLSSVTGILGMLFCWSGWRLT